MNLKHLVVVILFNVAITRQEALWTDVPEDVKQEVVNVQLVSTDDNSKEKTLSFRAFDEDFKFVIKPVAKNAIFAHNFEMYHTERNADGELIITTDENKDHENEGQLYTSDSSLTSVYITDDNKIHGILTPDLRIVPSAKGETHVVYRLPQQVISYHGDTVD